MADLLMRRRRVALFAAASIAAMAIPSVLNAQAAAPTNSDEQAAIVLRTDILPDANPPGGALDNTVNVTGVGQMRTVTNLATGGGFVCTGTAINPRTVIFAAHCVNAAPQSSYGQPSGGTPISFGFEADNTAARRIWQGLDPVTAQPLADQSQRFKSNPGRSLYNVEQVWYDPRSLGPGTFTFVQADVALATLDTHADNLPTWTMLFSPLTEVTHATINGYGARGANGTSGANLGVDGRRRIAENMIDFLGSLDDRNNLLFSTILGGAPGAPLLSATTYQLDFDDPAGVTVGLPGGFNFDIFPGQALAREGTTAGGDSGGPLIIDQKYSSKTIAGVLSGGSRFFGAQPFSSYGSTSFYQPLFLYWDVIVANNPYVYASAKAGSGNWFDPSRWVQDLDPNYKIDVGGQLVTGLPTTAAQGISSNTPKFGTVCYNEVNPDGTPAFSDCADVTSGTAGGPATQIAGGPGTQNFVPNNVTGNRLTGARASYYDVTLRNDGITVLDRAATIDRLTITGPAQLFVLNSGNLTVLGDYTQTGGLLSVNGTVKTGEALIGSGQLLGSGTFDPTFVTVMNAAVLPAGIGNFGNLTIKGDVILTSGTLLQLDINRTSQDKLVVSGDAQNPGIASLGGNLFVTRPRGQAPLDGQSFTILTATGGVQRTFDNVQARMGNLRGTVTYNANDVVLTYRAGRLGEMVSGSNPASAAFANALDAGRLGNYTNLLGLYSAIDVMESDQLTSTLAGLTPRVASAAQFEADQQRTMVLGMVGDRLSMLGTDRAKTGSFAIMGAPETLGLAIGQTSVSASTAAQRSFAGNVTSTGRTVGSLPENISGFLSGGYDTARASNGVAGSQRDTWHVAMGLEMEAADNLTLGTAFGYVNGRSNLIGSQAETKTSQAIAYGSYRLSKRAYVAGMASVTNSDIGVQRGVSTGVDSFSLNGDTHAMSYDMHLEAGMNFGVAKGLTLTPRAALRYASTEISGYRERGGEVALLVDDIKDRRFEGRLGVRMSGTVNAGSGWAFSPELGVDQVQAFSNSGSELQVRFANAAGIAFTLPGLSRDNAWTEVKGGMKLTNGQFSIGAGVESSLGRSDYRDNRAVASFSVRF
jgi:subtilase-type serine protease